MRILFSNCSRSTFFTKSTLGTTLIIKRISMHIPVKAEDSNDHYKPHWKLTANDRRTELMQTPTNDLTQPICHELREEFLATQQQYLENRPKEISLFVSPKSFQKKQPQVAKPALQMESPSNPGPRK